MKKEGNEIKFFLEYLNKTYSKLHTKYEKLFWVSYMYDDSVNNKKDLAQKNIDKFRSDIRLSEKVDLFLKKAKGTDRQSLLYWKNFFEKYQTPKELIELKSKIDSLESKIQSIRAGRKQGYFKPGTKKFVKAPVNQIKSLMATSDDEVTRKACFDALQTLSEPMLDHYVELINLRNEYAQKLGHNDFYEYKLKIEEGMTKKELFSIFDKIYQKTKYGFENIRKMEKEKPGLRKPWNFTYMMTGSFVKEEDPYFDFSKALTVWGKTFAGLGIDYANGTMTLDLLEREGKYNNGFCHWPELVMYKNGKRIPGKSNFTCNVILGIPGQGFDGLHTLFHEGGHAAHLLNTTMKDVCINHEYSPMSTAWAETQSMFLDTVLNSIEWKVRYAENKDGQKYPFDIFERKVRALNPIMPISMMSLMSVMYFEKDLYECKNITKEKVKEIARKNYDTFFDKSETSLTLLEIPHIYAWQSSCSYQGYALAELALSQWRSYFYKKYGYIVDNKNVGKEMKKAWKLGASLTFPDFVKFCTESTLKPDSYIKEITMDEKSIILRAKQRIKKLDSIKKFSGKIDLKAKIVLVHGKNKVADNSKGFEKMAEKYSQWLNNIK